jgi:hypothetical protein
VAAWIYASHQAGGIRAKVLILGTRNRRMVAEELYLKKTLRMDVIGLVSDNAGQMTLSYGNPKKVQIPIFARSFLTVLTASNHVNRILLARGGYFPPSYSKDLVAVRTMGVPIEDCHSFYERLASKIAISDLPPEWIALSKGFHRDRLILAAKRVIDVSVSFLGWVLSAPIVFLIP